ncbi:MAG: M43 family zinc metalloprotease, partial [Saprospiraceae bacterium]
MNYFQSILLVFLFSTFTKVLSQEICGFDAMHHSLTLLDPTYLINISAGNKLIHSLNQKTPNQSNLRNPPYLISVVVHVISPSSSAIGTNYNPSLTNIRKSIQNINLALANQGIFNSALGLNTNIQLCLASIDPTNNPTNGITRTSSALVEEGVCNPGTNIKNESLIKLLANWDCTRYLNIWLVTNLYSDQQGCSFNGFSYFPYAPCGLDGLMLESNNYQSPQGVEVAIHELGHYLGLYHTFEGGCYNNDCTLDGDQICDTPPDQSPYYADCSTNSCQTELPDRLDDNANYMDISDCTPKHFTQGQVDRMHAVLELIRNKLWGSNNCNNSFLNLGLYNVKAIGPICSDTLCLNLFIYNNSDQSINLSTIEIKDSTLIILNQNVNVNVPAHDSIVFATSCIKVPSGLHSIQVTVNKNIPDDDPSDNLYLIKWINYNAVNLSLVNLTPTHCISDGTIEVIANGGLAPYIYAINNRINPQTFPYFQLLTTGMYTITSTDRNQCSAMLNVDIPDSCKVPNNKKFIHNKDAFPTGNDCSTLTRELNNQAGSVWYEDKINLTQDFTVNFEFFLGCKDQTGADGIAFVLQPISTAIGVAGGGIGYQNVKPSIEVEFDTWRNPEFNDVGFDHVAIMRNGNNNHLTPDNLAGPVAISNAFVNAEDCKFHKGLVKWIAATKRLEVYVECDLRLRYTGDIVKDIFNNDPNVFFGFTSSTGNSNNLQQICLKYVTGANTLPNYSICEGENVQISARPNFKKYLWTPNIDINNANISNPIFSPKKTMKYYLEITDQCGFITLDSTIITVLPSSINYKLSYDDSCNVNSKSHLIIIPNPTDTSKSFSLDGITFINQLNYTIDSNGLYTLFHKTGNCIANELLDIQPYSNFLKDTVISLLNVVCNKKGSIFINALGGFPPYKFRLNGLVWQNSGSFDNLDSGTYFYEIMDQSSCIVTDTLIITDYQYAINVDIDSSNFVKTCCSPIAFVALKVNPLNQKYLFNLDNKSWNFSNNFVNLLDGPHKIQVRDEFGCISDTLEFAVSDLRQNYLATNKFQLCNGETIWVGSKIYTTSGIYTDSLKSQYCCDSIIVSELEVYPIFQFQNNQNICQGNQVKVGNNIYTTSGNYIDTLQSIHSCDSIVLTNLKVSNISRDSNNYTVCKGNSIRVGNKVYSLSGDYIDTLQSQQGCDSILFTKLTVN